MKARLKHLWNEIEKFNKCNEEIKAGAPPILVYIFCQTDTRSIGYLYQSQRKSMLGLV